MTSSFVFSDKRTAECVDSVNYCKTFAKAGYCSDKNVAAQCPLSCKSCQKPSSECKDQLSVCPAMKSKCLNNKLMQTTCPETCQLCSSSIKPGTKLKIKNCNFKVNKK